MPSPSRGHPCGRGLYVGHLVLCILTEVPRIRTQLRRLSPLQRQPPLWCWPCPGAWSSQQSGSSTVCGAIGPRPRRDRACRASSPRCAERLGDVLPTQHPVISSTGAGPLVDFDTCEDLARRDASSSTSAAEVAELLRQALGLWRGEPLDGVSAPGIECDRVRLRRAAGGATGGAVRRGPGTRPSRPSRRPTLAPPRCRRTPCASGSRAS